MNIVIIGDGKVGNTLMRQLSKEGHDIVIIDNDNDVVEHALNSYDVMAISGNGASYSVQRQAGVHKADILISATSSDELNMLSSLIGKKLGAKHTVARVRNPEYAEQLFIMSDSLAIERVINPEHSAAKEIARILKFPTALRVETFTRGQAELVEIKVLEGSKLDGLSLGSLYNKYQVNVLVCAVERGNEVIIPSGDFIIRGNDKISIAATASETVRFFKKTDILVERIKNIMIVGASRIGYYLSKELLELGMNVTIIDQNEEKCIQMSEMLPKATIVHGDGTDHDLLVEIGINETEGFVSLTNIDEVNIILSLFAMKMEVNKVMAKVNKLSFSKLVTKDLANNFISPKYLAANEIVSYVRGLQNTVGCGVRTLHKIINNQVEVLEFAIPVKEEFVSIPLKQLKFRNNLLIACILRGKQTIIPRGDDTIEVGDNVVVVTTIPYLRDLKDIFRGL